MLACRSKWTATIGGWTTSTGSSRLEASSEAAAGATPARQRSGLVRRPGRRRSSVFRAAWSTRRHPEAADRRARRPGAAVGLRRRHPARRLRWGREHRRGDDARDHGSDDRFIVECPEIFERAAAPRENRHRWCLFRVACRRPCGGETAARQSGTPEGLAALGFATGRPDAPSDADEPCTETVKLVTRTASNVYFPNAVSVLSIPDPALLLRAAVERVVRPSPRLVAPES